MERNMTVHGERARFFDFVVELRGIEPRIWRRFLLRLDQTFEDLHKAIQDAAGWQDYRKRPVNRIYDHGCDWDSVQAMDMYARGRCGQERSNEATVVLRAFEWELA